MFHQGDGLLPPGTGFGLAGVVGLQQLHQGSSQLLRRPPRALALEGVPVPIGDRQQALQAHRLLRRPGGPASRWAGSAGSGSRRSWVLRGGGGQSGRSLLHRIVPWTGITASSHPVG